MGIFDFDKFALKDIWGQIKDNPERLLVGAIDPLSTKMWNGILGKDYEPLIDQMGGPYGGHTISAFGNQDGGVYGRAEAAGIDTKTGGQMHDAAHVLSAIFGGQGLMGLGGGAPAGGGNLGIFANGGTGGMGTVGGGNAGLLASSGGISGGAGGGLGSMGSLQNLAKLNQFMPQQQQQQPAPYTARPGAAPQQISYLPPEPPNDEASRASMALNEIKRRRIMEMMA